MNSPPPAPRQCRCERAWSSAAFLALALVWPVVSTGCGRHGKPAPKGGSEIPPSKVKLERTVGLAKAGPMELDYEMDVVGSVEADMTDIAAGVSGVVDAVLFQEGQWVDEK